MNGSASTALTGPDLIQVLKRPTQRQALAGTRRVIACVARTPIGFGPPPRLSLAVLLQCRKTRGSVCLQGWPRRK